MFYVNKKLIFIRVGVRVRVAIRVRVANLNLVNSLALYTHSTHPVMCAKWPMELVSHKALIFVIIHSQPQVGKCVGKTNINVSSKK